MNKKRKLGIFVLANLLVFSSVSTAFSAENNLNSCNNRTQISLRMCDNKIEQYEEIKGISQFKLFFKVPFCVTYLNKNIIIDNNFNYNNSDKINQTEISKEEINENDQNDNSTFKLTAEEKELLDLVNKERKANGLASLTINEDLVKVARLKALDMIDKNYFSHTSPTYGNLFKMLKQFNISYSYAGENLAGNSIISLAHESLINSSGHRANILGQNYKQIGIGIVDGGVYGKMIVQLFIG